MRSFLLSKTALFLVLLKIWFSNSPLDVDGFGGKMMMTLSCQSSFRGGCGRGFGFEGERSEIVGKKNGPA